MAEATSPKKNVVDHAMVPAISGEGENSAVIIRTEDIATLNTLMKVSAELGASGMFPDLKNRGQYLAVILAGNARGYDPMTALMNIHIVNGRLGMSGQMIAAELRKAGVNFDVLESTSRTCRIEFTRPGKKPFTYEFSEDDAKRAGKIGPNCKDGSVWKAYPQDMLYWRCLTAGARKYAPDAIMGLYLKDEVEEIVYEDVTDITTTATGSQSTKDSLRAKADRVRPQAAPAPETTQETAPEAQGGEAGDQATEEASEAESDGQDAPAFDREALVKEIVAIESQKDIKPPFEREKNLGLLDLNRPELDEGILICYRDYLKTCPDKKKTKAGEEF